MEWRGAGGEGGEGGRRGGGREWNGGGGGGGEGKGGLIKTFLAATTTDNLYVDAIEAVLSTYFFH